MADDTLSPDELVSDGVMVRHLKEGDYYYNVPKKLPTEPSDGADPYAKAASDYRAIGEAPSLPMQSGQWSKPETPYQPPNYLMQSDLLDAQQGQQSLPTGIVLRDDGVPVNQQTGAEIPTVQRPNVLPIAKTPDGYTLAMPKMLDLASNIMGGVAAPAVATKAGEVVLGSGAVKKLTPVAGNPFEAAQPFYSTLERAVDDAKLSKGSADQWLGYLKNQPGVKSEEINTVLGDLKGNLTKQEVQDVVKNNGVKLGEVNKGEMKVNTDSKYYSPEVKRAIKDAGDNPGELALTLANDGDAYRALTKKFPELVEDEDWAAKVANDVYGGDTKPTGTTKYHGYQLPGGENYKEMLMTLPSRAQRSGASIKIQVDKLRAKYGDNFADKWTDAEREDYVKGNTVPDFKSSHWDEPNIVAHVRMNDRFINDPNGPSIKGENKETTDLYKNLTGNDPKKIEQRGFKTLHLEEIQSDWGQKIRKEGYQLDPKERITLDANAKSVDDKLIAAKRDDIMGNPDLKSGLDQAIKDKIISQKEADDYLKLTQNENSTTPNMPFKKNWDELALKRMLHKAATEGYEGLSWTPGEAQAARYDLSKQIDEIRFAKNEDGTYNIVPFKNKEPMHAIEKENLKPSELADTIGKEAAEKLIAKANAAKPYEPITKLPEGYHLIHDRNGSSKAYPWGEWGISSPDEKSAKSFTGRYHATEEEAKNKALEILNENAKRKHDAANSTLENVDLKIGGEGMKSFYDKMLVDKANNLAKKYGSKVEEKQIESPGGIGQWKYEGPDKTVEELSKIYQSRKLTSSLSAQLSDVLAKMGAGTPYAKAIENNGSYALAEKLGGELKPISKTQPIHYLPITDALRAKAKQGFPLFSSTPTLTAVSHDPFNRENKNYKLTSVQGNPFDPKANAAAIEAHRSNGGRADLNNPVPAGPAPSYGLRPPVMDQNLPEYNQFQPNSLE